MSMNCRDFERFWIIRSPGELPPAMSAHLSSCPACAALAHGDAAADATLQRLGAAQPVPDVDRARLAIRRALEAQSSPASLASWRRPMLVALAGLASAAALAALRLERPAKHEIADAHKVAPSIVLPAPLTGQQDVERKAASVDAPRPQRPAVNGGPAPLERPIHGPGATQPGADTKGPGTRVAGDRSLPEGRRVVYGPGTHGLGTLNPSAHGPGTHGLAPTRASDAPGTGHGPHSAVPRSPLRNSPEEPSDADLLALNEGAPLSAQPFAPEPAPPVRPLITLPPAQARNPGSALVDDLLYLNPVRIASTDDSGLRGAVQAIAAAAPATDPRLEQKVYVHASGRPLAEILGGLSKATGVTLVPRMEVAAEKISLWADDRPLMDVMRDIRHLRGYYWSRSKRRDQYVYSLWQDAQSRSREAAEIQSQALDAQRRFAEEIEKHVKALKASDAELKRLAQDDPYLVAQMLHPVVRAGYQLFAALAPDQQAQLLQGQTPSRGLSAGEMLNTFPLASQPGDKWFDSPEYRAGMAPLGDIVSLKMSDMTPEQRAAVAAIVKGAVQANRRETERIRQEDSSETHQSGYLEWHASALAAADLSTATVSLFRWGDPDFEGLSLRVDVQSGGRGWGIYSNIGMPPGSEKFYNDSMRQGKLRNMPGFAEVIDQYLIPKARHEEAPADEAALLPGESADPTLDAPISVTWRLAVRDGHPAACYGLDPGEVLAALSRALGRPLAVDPMPIWMELPRTGAPEFRWEKRSLRALLHHLFPGWSCHTDAGAIFVSKPGTPHHTVNEVPPTVEAFLRARQEPFTLDDMALLARSLTPWQLGKLSQYLPTAAMDQMLAAQELLRLYGELAPVQRAALARGLPYAGMTPAQQALFLAFAERQRPFIEPWRFQSGALRLTQEPAPGRPQWDNAFRLAGRAEFTVRFQEDDMARYPLELVGKPEHDPWRQPVAALLGKPFPGFHGVSWHYGGSHASDPIHQPTLNDPRLQGKPTVIVIARPYAEPYIGTHAEPTSAAWARDLAARLRGSVVTVVHETLGPREATPAPAAAAQPSNLVDLWDEGDSNAQPFDSMGGGEHIDQSPTVFVVGSNGIVRALFEGQDAWDSARVEAAARDLATPDTAAAARLP